MENSEIEKQVINLGKILTKELDLESSSDTLSRWMVYYISEKIKLAENSNGLEKSNIEQECYDTILKLWKHRWTLRKQPLENFAPILNLLQEITPEKEDPYFFRTVPEKDINLTEKKSVKDSLNVIKNIDKTARIWIDFILKQAALEAQDEATKELLQNTTDLPDIDDIKIITILLDKEINTSEENEDSTMKKYEIEKIKNRIEHLEKFTQFNELMLNLYKKELSRIQEDNTTK
jgi:hypothetical protein